VTTKSRPSIYQLGQVLDDGHTITIRGWGLGLCAIRCDCHAHPDDGYLTIRDDGTGTLGLVSHRPCTCCQPWTADELAAVLHDLADVTALTTT
jgi:hypothetical protein